MEYLSLPNARCMDPIIKVTMSHLPSPAHDVTALIGRAANRCDAARATMMAMRKVVCTSSPIDMSPMDLPTMD